MTNSNIFIIYADASGTNVTLSPRLGAGEREPDFNKDAQVSLLEGSGIADGKMTANVRCTCFPRLPSSSAIIVPAFADEDTPNRLELRKLGDWYNGFYIQQNAMDMGR